MALFLRDPFREMYRDPFSDVDRMLRPRYHRVRRANLEDLVPVVHNLHHFDHALNELQSVMDHVNDAIGHYQNDMQRDIAAGGMTQSLTKDGNLQYSIDVSQYKPEEIQVKIDNDNLVVEAATESSDKDSYHKAHFKRWMKLPDDCKRNNIKSSLTADKKLLIHVPMAKPITNSNTRTIPIDIHQAQAIGNEKSGDKGQEKEQSDAKK